MVGEKDSDFEKVKALAALKDVADVWINEEFEIVQKTRSEKFLRAIGFGPDNEDLNRVARNWHELAKKFRGRIVTKQQLKDFVNANGKMRTLLASFSSEQQMWENIEKIIAEQQQKINEQEKFEEEQREIHTLEAFNDQIKKHPACEGNYWKDLKGYPAGVYHIYSAKEEENTYYIRYFSVIDDVYREEIIRVMVSLLGFSARGVSKDNKSLSEGGFENFEELISRLQEKEKLTYPVNSPEALAAKESIDSFKKQLEDHAAYIASDELSPLFPDKGYRIIIGRAHALADQYFVEYLSCCDEFGSYKLVKQPFLITEKGFNVWGEGPFSRIGNVMNAIEEKIAEISDVGIVTAHKAAVDHMAALYLERWQRIQRNIPAKSFKDLEVTVQHLIDTKGKSEKSSDRWIAFYDLVEQIFSKYENLPAHLHPFRMIPDLSGKDRDQAIVPYQYNRIGAYDTTEYINASNIVIHGQRYIIAQGPLESTVQDFWKMIIRENISKIVNLASKEEAGRFACADYWSHDVCPIDLGDGRSIHYEGEEEIVRRRVTNELRQVVTQRIVVRKLCLRGDHEEKYFTQFHYENWPEGDVPIMDFFVTLLQRVQKNQCLLVHARKGAGRTGTFVASHSIIYGIIEPQAKENKEFKDIVVNPDKTVLQLRLQRADQVENISQLEFISMALVNYFSKTQH